MFCVKMMRRFARQSVRFLISRTLSVSYKLASYSATIPLDRALLHLLINSYSNQVVPLIEIVHFPESPPLIKILLVVPLLAPLLSPAMIQTVFPRQSNTRTLILSKQIPPLQLQRYLVCFISSSSNYKSKCSTRRASTRCPSFIRQTVTRNLAQTQRVSALRARRRFNSYNPLSNATRTSTSSMTSRKKSSQPVSSPFLPRST